MKLAEHLRDVRRYQLEEVRRLLNEYQHHRDDKLYESVMDIIVRANYEEFEEVRGSMCKALEELMADVIAERQKEAEDKGVAQGMAQGRVQGKKEIIRNMLANGIAIEQVAQIAKMPIEEIKAL